MQIAALRKSVAVSFPARLGHALRRGPLHIIIIAICLLWMVPAVGLLVSSFRPPSVVTRTGWWTALHPTFHFTLDNYQKVLTTNHMGQSFVNSLLVTIPATAIPILIAAYAAMFDLTGRVFRFGNVVGSRGSVVPLFERQIAKGGPVTITHREMTRYMMTIREAASLVLSSLIMSKPSHLYMLDMGEPIRIFDLANDLIRSRGMRPDVDIKVVITGLRPGERLTEELLAPDEGWRPTVHPSIREVISPGGADEHERQHAELLAVVLDREIDARVTVGARRDPPPGGQVGDGGGRVLLDEAVPGLSSGVVADKGQHAVPQAQAPYHTGRRASGREITRCRRRRLAPTSRDSRSACIPYGAVRP